MAATGVNVNWKDVSHNGTGITRVTQVSINQGGSLVEFAGDDDRYPTVLANKMGKPTASLTTADVGSAMALTRGTDGTLLATHVDAMDATGGAVTYTMTHAVLEDVSASGSFGQPGTATVKFRAYSVDGTTNPLSLSRS